MSDTVYRFRGSIKPYPGIRDSVLDPEIEGTVATLRIYDSFDSWGGDWGVSAKEFAVALAALPEDTSEIRLHINSPGGEVWEAITILNLLRQHKARVVAIVDGIAASSASFLAAGADETIMGRNATTMVHDAWGISIGNARDMTDTANILDKVSNNIAAIYAEKASGTVEEWRAVMLAETWFTAGEAVEAGIADRVDTAAGATVKNEFDLTVFGYAGRDEAPDPTTILPRRALAHAARMGTPKPPAEPVENINPPRKGTAMADLIKGLRERLGISADSQVDDEGLLQAVDAALIAHHEFTPPEGTVLMDAAQLTDLQAAAEEGRQARREQIRADRVSLVDDAVKDGRIPIARTGHWMQQLDADDEGARAVLASLAPNTIPLSPVGYTGGVDEASDEDRLYSKAWGTTEKKES